jgi:hypothetical protein
LVNYFKKNNNNNIYIKNIKTFHQTRPLLSSHSSHGKLALGGQEGVLISKRYKKLFS